MTPGYGSDAPPTNINTQLKTINNNHTNNPDIPVRNIITVRWKQNQYKYSIVTLETPITPMTQLEIFNNNPSKSNNTIRNIQ